MARKGRSCELCSSDARMFCESDQARLCWDCDQKVHAANFLVAKHTRTALCHVCHSPTPWKASGPMLGRTVSVCGVCVARSARAGGGSVRNCGVVAADEEEEEPAPRSGNVRIAGGGSGGYMRREVIGADHDDSENDDEDISDSDGDEFDGSDDDDEDDDDENQVVPWTSTPPPPASATSTSCSEEEDSSSFGGGEAVSTSRFRDLQFSLNSTSEIKVRGSSSSSMAARSRVLAGDDEEILRGGFVRPWKHRRVEMQP